MNREYRLSTLVPAVLLVALVLGALINYCVQRDLEERSAPTPTITIYQEEVMGKLPTGEEIEGAFKPARDIVDLMHDPTAKRRAEENLKVAEEYVHRDRERAKVIDRDAPADQRIVTTEQRGPAMLGWPFKSRLTAWRWTDDTAP